MLQFLPRRSTLVLTAALTVLWLPIFADLLDGLGDPWSTVGLIVLVLGCFGVAGLYGALATLKSPPPEGRRVRFLALITLRTILMTGVAIGLASLAG
jgi:hypothetical protein